jgi:hypothetical protein
MKRFVTLAFVTQVVATVGKRHIAVDAFDSHLQLMPTTF